MNCLLVGKICIILSRYLNIPGNELFCDSLVNVDTIGINIARPIASANPAIKIKGIKVLTFGTLFNNEKIFI